ncbi:MAG: DUF1573 domain-containing protein [Bacteroidaceae bacterium]|nr:DUF1573 domain-containing protein [Bacteroidaceae bacterium]
MKYLQTFLLLAALTLSLGSQAQGRLEAETDVLNVGEILYQSPRTLTYKLVNRGTEPVTITTVIPSCGCTQVKYQTSPISAGESAELIATYDARTLGTFQKEIEVYNSAAAEPLYLTFQGRVVADASDYGGGFPVDMGSVKLSTADIEFADVNMGDHPEANIMVLNNSRQTLRPQLMHLPTYLSASYHPEQLAAGRVGRIALRLNTERLMAYGLTQTTINMARSLGDKVSEDNQIDVTAVLLPKLPKRTAEEMAQAPILVCEYDTIDFSNQMQKKGKKLKRTITVGNAGAQVLNIYSVQVYGHSATVKLSNRKIAPDGKARLTLTIDKARLQKQKTEPRVLIITDDPRHPKTTLVCKVVEN